MGDKEKGGYGRKRRKIRKKGKREYWRKSRIHYLCQKRKQGFQKHRKKDIDEKIQIQINKKKLFTIF